MGNQCGDCRVLKETAWPHLSWETMVIRVEAEAGFAKEVQNALSVLQGLCERRFRKQSFDTEQGLEVLLEKRLILMGEAAFEKEFKVKAKEVGADVVCLMSEEGEEIKGVLMQEDTAAHRHVIVRSRVSTCLRSHLMAPSEQLRAEQGKDLQKWYEQDLVRQRPRSMSTPQSFAEMKAKVAAYVQKKAEERAFREKEKEELAKLEQQRAQQPDMPSGPIPVKSEIEEQEASEETESEDEGRLLLPSEMHKGKRKKGGKGGKAGGKGGKKGLQGSKDSGQKRRKTEAASHVVPAPTPAPPPSSAKPASVRSGKHSDNSGRSAAATRMTQRRAALAGCSPSEKRTQDMEYYMEWVSVDDLLACKSLGNAMHQAERKLKSWVDEDPELEHSAEYVQLKQHLDIGRQAEKLATEMGKLSKQDRDNLMEQVMPHATNLTAQFQSDLLGAICRDHTYKSKADVEMLLAMVWPQTGASQ